MGASGSLSDFLAAERTFLAWIRTGLALMGLGFVVARFGLFLQTLRTGQLELPLQPYGPSFWFGTSLILLGVAVQFFSALSHVRLARRLSSGDAAIEGPSTLAILVAVLLALIGLAMSVYLISVRDPAPPRAAQVQEEACRPIRLMES